jgi:hypothetical protein
LTIVGQKEQHVGRNDKPDSKPVDSTRVSIQQAEELGAHGGKIALPIDNGTIGVYKR